MHSALSLMGEFARRQTIRGSLFPEQREAVEHPSRLRALQCSRRSGKTTAAMTEFVLDSLDYPRCEYAYIALTSRSARQIAWPIIRELNHVHRLGAKMRENLLRVEMPNEAALVLYGADRSDWVDRLLGQKLRKVWIDEAAFFTVGLKRLIYEVLQPTVSDLRGSITLMSTPGHVLKGLFYDIMETKKVRGWQPFKWGWEQNPHMAEQVREMLAAESAANPDFMSWPSTQRMWGNQWAQEAGARVYMFDPERNGIDAYPLDDQAALLRHRFVLGIDPGWSHSTGFSVGCWTPDHSRWIELESYKERQMQIPDIAARCKMYSEFYPGLRMVCDPAATRELEELRRRYGLHIEPAEKQDKLYWINQYNSDLSAGKVAIVAPASSPHAEEMMDLTWETDVDGEPIVNKVTKEMVESRRFPNDCCDAALYAYRHSFHFTHTKPSVPPAKGTPAWYDKLADKMEEEAEERYREGERW